MPRWLPHAIAIPLSPAKPQTNFEHLCPATGMEWGASYRKMQHVHFQLPASRDLRRKAGPHDRAQTAIPSPRPVLNLHSGGQLENGKRHP